MTTTKKGKLWSTLHGGEFEVRGLVEADYKEALDVLNESFFINEPICNACEINLTEYEQARQELRELCRMSALDGVSLIIRHVPSNKIAAVSFNKVQYTPPIGEEDFFAKFRNEQTKSPQACRLMDFMIEIDGIVDIRAMYNMSVYCELMFLATLPEFGRKGLGRALAESTIELTRAYAQGTELEHIAPQLRELRPSAVTAIWTSCFSRKIGAQTGFKVLTSEPYSKFSYNGKSFDQVIDPIHDQCELVAFKI